MAQIPIISTDTLNKNVVSAVNIGQYLGPSDLINAIPKIDVKPEELGSTDTYNETKILSKYLSLDETGQKLIYKCAIQLAVIGYGNKNYGFVRLNDKEVITLVDIFKKYNVKYNESLNSKYSDDDLSARRLLRLFRYQIQDFIITKKRPSYLWLKYADKTKIDFLPICFPGGEHLVEKPEEALFLLETYGNLDTIMKTRFRQRLQRVFIARGLLSPQLFIGLNY